MTVLFGSVEYFEREIEEYLTDNQVEEVTEDQLSVITSKLETELLYDFVCDEKIRRQCLNNLTFASGNVKNGGYQSAAGN
ncbi:hypothetical protein GCM10009865_10820 [Aeromicrobium ponti]|uniref:Uncharacterized protein n=1 Tax=Cytobacillus oceanisediminis TaxID=665099 RepID=A0A562K2Q3_9BACI|nr:hypothetical protein [Cytobacillus oceanisediminis]TWH89710.1 hypothetical protein IQ19_00957 [Cytobacillus oceanisediminis]